MNRLTQCDVRIGARLVPAALALLFCLTSCSKDEQADSALEPSSPILAQIGDEVITVADLEAEQLIRQASGLRKHDDPAALLEELVTRKAMVRSALDRGMDREPAVAKVIENLLISELRSRELGVTSAGVAVTEAEIESVYKARAAEFTQPGKVRLAILSRELSPGTSPTRRQELVTQMEDLRQLAIALPEGERFFGSLATKHSEDQATRYRDGDAGWFDAGRTGYRWPDEVIAAGFTLAESGALSDLIEIPGEALYLVRKVDARGTSVASIDSVRARITAGLREKKRQQSQEQFFAAQRDFVGVQIFAENLDRVSLAPAAADVAVDVTPPSLPSSR
jgi:hypothetical protein